MLHARAKWSILSLLLLPISFAVGGCGTGPAHVAGGHAGSRPSVAEQMPVRSQLYGDLPCPDAQKVATPTVAFQTLGGDAFESAAHDMSTLERVVPTTLGTLDGSWICPKSYSAVLVTSSGSRVVLAPLGDLDVQGYFKEFLANDPGRIVELGGEPALITPSDGVKQDRLEGWPEPGRGTAQFALGKLWVVILGNHLLAEDQMIASAAEMVGINGKGAP